MGPQLGMDAVGGDDDIRLGGGAVGEFDARLVAVLLEAHGAVVAMHDAGRQVGGEVVDKIGAVHAVGCVPAMQVGDLHRRDRLAVVAEVLGVPADPGAVFLDCAPRPTRSRWRTAFGVM